MTDTFTPTRVSVRDEYDDKGTLTLWSGPFASNYEAIARPRRDGSGYRITPAYAPAFTVSCPLRSDDTWTQTDDAIAKRWAEWETRRHNRKAARTEAVSA